MMNSDTIRHSRNAKLTTSALGKLQPIMTYGMASILHIALCSIG
jgi:hypothetical protein